MQLGEVYAEDGVRRLAQHEMPSLRAARGEEYDDIRMWVGSDPVTRRACSVSARSVRDADGTFVGAALAYKDVTEFLRSMGVKDDFVAMVSHEFRTPLTSIHGYVSLLLDDADRLHPDDVHYLKVVARNTERLHRLVTDLLASTEHDGRPMEIERTPTNACEIVRAAVESARPAAEHKELNLTVATPSYIRIMVDPQRFAQVVDNLVSNAVKYTPIGGSVTVDLTAYDDHIELVGRGHGHRHRPRRRRTGCSPGSSEPGTPRSARSRASASACRSPRRSSRPTGAGVDVDSSEAGSHVPGVAAPRPGPGRGARAGPRGPRDAARRDRAAQDQLSPTPRRTFSIDLPLASSSTSLSR